MSTFTLFYKQFYFQDILCHEVTTSTYGNSLAEQTSCYPRNSKIDESQQQWRSSPLESSSYDANSAKANQSPCVVLQASLPQIIESPHLSVYPTINQAMGIVRPVSKSTPLNKGGSNNGLSIDTTTSEIKTSSNLTPAPTCAISKVSDSMPQHQSATSVTGVESLQSYLSGAVCPSALVNTAFAPNTAASLCPSHHYELPKYAFQLPTVYPKETTSPNYAQQPHSSPKAATHTVFTQPPNLDSPRYYIQKTPCTVDDVDPINISLVSSLPRSGLPSNIQVPQVLFLIDSNTPSETTIVQNKGKSGISVDNSFSTQAFPREYYGNIATVERVNADNTNAIDEPAITLDVESGAANSQWPINLVLNFPSVNLPAQPETRLLTPSSSSALSLSMEPAPMITPTMPIIVNSSKSKLKSLLPILMMSLVNDGAPGCSCNCGFESIPVPIPIPIPTNCPIIDTRRQNSRKSGDSKRN